MKAVSAEDLKSLVKDLMGGVQVTGFISMSPNKDVLRVGDIITTIDGQRVQSLSAITIAIDSAKDKDHISLRIIRDGASQTVQVKALDVSNEAEGQSQQFITQACTVPEIKQRPICQDASRVPATQQQQ
jgi:S1-C subfamily serine protease